MGVRTGTVTWCFTLLFLMAFVVLHGEEVAPSPPPFERGIASWYTAPPGALPANGEVFDPTALAAAHKSLKFGTIVRVVNETNGRSVEVRIFDRGPFVEGRIIDLTPAAAEAIGLIGPGIAMETLNLQYVPEQPDSRYDRPGDTGWYLLQVGTFADSSRAMKVYRTLVDAGFKVKVEPVLQRLVRLSVRWVPEEDLAATLARLAELGFDSVLKRSEVNPHK